jgi:hypothetical protein
VFSQQPWADVMRYMKSYAHGSVSFCSQRGGVLAKYAAFLYVVVGWSNHMIKQDDHKFRLPCHESEELSLALSLQ